MNTFSHYGAGVKVHAIEQRPDGKVEFTLWFTVFWIPIIPLSSWAALYAGELTPDGIREDGHSFRDVVRVKRDTIRYVQTFAYSILTLGFAVAPAAILIERTNGRAATSIEMVFLFASAAWPVVIILLIERHRRRLLKKMNLSWMKGGK